MYNIHTRYTVHDSYTVIPWNAAFFDGYCSTVQGVLDWIEVDVGLPELVFFRLLCVFCVFLFVLLPLVLLLSFLEILHCLPRAVGVPLESALNLVSRMRPCGAYDTHACPAQSNEVSSIFTPRSRGYSQGILVIPRYWCVLQCVAVCCSVLQCVAVCCSVVLVIHRNRVVQPIAERVAQNLEIISKENQCI